MEHILKGAPVAEAMGRRSAEAVALLQTLGITPKLAIIRVGDNAADVRYERSIMKLAESFDVAVQLLQLPARVPETDVEQEILRLNRDPKVHGILMFRPLPPHMDEERLCQLIEPAKDVDGATNQSLSGVFTGKPIGFAPSTADAIMELLHYYGISPENKNVTVLGRSLVVGRAVAMMLMEENGTVTICHSKTVDAARQARAADILVCATGRLESVGPDYVREGQIIVDVGIVWNEKKQKICGDVDYDTVEPLAAAITPVLGGVGTVTTSVLLSHVVEAAKRLSGV